VASLKVLEGPIQTREFYENGCPKLAGLAFFFFKIPSEGNSDELSLGD